MIEDHSKRAVASDMPANDAARESTQVFVTKLHCGNSLLQAGLERLLSDTCFVVPGAAPTTVSSSTRSEADLCIIDATTSFEQALELIQDAKSQHPAARIVAIANRLDGATVHAAVSAGVDSFCVATSGRDVLIKTLELTMLGERILPGSVVRDLINQDFVSSGTADIIPLADRRPSDPKMQKLSPRETVILQSLMGGDPNKVIARKLDITEATIKVHVKAILRKIGVANRTQAAMWATGNLKETGSAAGEFRELRRMS